MKKIALTVAMLSLGLAACDDKNDNDRPDRDDIEFNITDPDSNIYDGEHPIEDEAPIA